MLFEKNKKIEIGNAEYPDSLNKIKNSPKELYYSGDLSLVNKNCFAVVGSRKISSYGKMVSYDIVGQLIEAGFIIVSGLAVGVDSLAHQITIEKKGKCIAVLGNGIDEKNFYPKINIKLAQKIIEQGGLIISEYPAGTSATKFTFPQRNRIIAGLSLGVLVIEAGKKSGSLITANYGFSQGKKVFAVPSSIYKKESRGCNLLIKKGAVFTENINDILSEFGKLNLQFSLKKREVVGNSKEEQLILNSLKGEELNLEKIIERTKLSPAEIMCNIATLEIEDKIQDLGNNIYSIKK